MTIEDRDLDYYKILGITYEATQDQIKERYRRLVLTYHPDKNQSAEAAERFREIRAAYQVLSNPMKRSQYDQYGKDFESKEGFAFTIISDLIVQTIFSVTLPLDNISRRRKIYNATLPTISSIWKTEGWNGIWRGWSMHLTNSLLYGHVRNLFSVAAKSASESTSSTQLKTSLLSEDVGLMAAQTLCYPLEVITTCVCTRQVSGFFDATKKIFGNNGFLGFYSGWIPFLGYSFTLASCARSFETSRVNAWIEIKTRDLIVEQKLLKPLVMKGFGLILKAAFVSLVTCPLRTLAIRMQTDAAVETASYNFLKALAVIIRNEGFWKGLYRGYLWDVLFCAANDFIPTISKFIELYSKA